MRIYVDLRCLQDPGYAFRGIGHHSASLLRHARRFTGGSVEIIGILDAEVGELPAAYRQLVDVVQQFPSARLGDEAALVLQLSPATHDQARLAPLLGRAGVFCGAVVYDFIPLEGPERYLPTAVARRAYLNRMLWLKFYHRFFPISQHVAHRLAEVLGIGDESIEVTGACVRPAFADFDPARAPEIPHRSIFPPQEYFLVVGGTDPRKNEECAVAAHARLPARPAAPTGLVVVGNHDAAGRARLAKVYQENGGLPARIEFLGGLPDDELAALYHRAIATICPSRSEGFSLPVVEAISTGCPVLAADCPAQRELLGPAPSLFDPNDPGRLAALMGAFLVGPAARQQLLGEQRHIAPQFAEQTVAGRFWTRLLRDFQAQRRRAPAALRSGKPRIAFLTPYPPDHSGVADYSACCFRSLAKHATIDVFTDARPVGPQPFVRHFGPISRFPYVVDDYDRLVAVVGNSRFHARIIDQHCRYGGPCVAHDNHMTDYLSWRYGPEGFGRMAGRDLGRTVSLDEVRLWVDDPDQAPSIFLRDVALRADPLMVHSRGLQQRVAREYAVQATHLPFCCYRQFTHADLSEGERWAARRRLGIPADHLTIITLGLVHPWKLPRRCLQVLERLLAWGLPADLHFVGSAHVLQEPLQTWSDQLGITGHVHLTEDWMAEEKYRDYLVAADFAIQLRLHAQGALSGAVLDCVSAGLPAVVTREMAEALDAPDYILRVADQHNPEAVAEQLARAYQAGTHHQRISPLREAYVREHSFDNYAVQMMHALGLA